MSETVKRMLTEDIGLKDELINKIKNIVRWQVATIIVCVIIFFGGFEYYNKTKTLVLKSIQEEKKLIQRQRDSLRFEKEIFYRLQDTTQFFVMPIRDTIKIKNGHTK